jgi:hypothetical protein
MGVLEAIQKLPLDPMIVLEVTPRTPTFGILNPPPSKKNIKTYNLNI